MPKYKNTIELKRALRQLRDACEGCCDAINDGAGPLPASFDSLASLAQYVAELAAMCDDKPPQG